MSLEELSSIEGNGSEEKSSDLDRMAEYRILPLDFSEIESQRWFNESSSYVERYMSDRSVQMQLACIVGDHEKVTQLQSEIITAMEVTTKYGGERFKKKINQLIEGIPGRMGPLMSKEDSLLLAASLGEKIWKDPKQHIVGAKYAIKIGEQEGKPLFYYPEQRNIMTLPEKDIKKLKQLTNDEIVHIEDWNQKAY